MLSDQNSTTAFAPPIPWVLRESADRRGVESAPRVRPHGLIPRANTSASSLEINGLALRIPRELVPGKAQFTIDISKRVQFLKFEAEIEGIPFSETSLADFKAFIQEIDPRARPYLFLNDNGNFRALWKNAEREQIGLQFLGEGNIQFVIFKSRKGSLPMARISGIDAKDKMMGHIKASGAEGLLHGC